MTKVEILNLNLHPNLTRLVILSDFVIRVSVFIEGLRERERESLSLRVCRDSLHFTAREFRLIITPAHLRFAISNRDHRNAVVHRTYDVTEIAADTLLFFDLWNRLARHAARAETVAIRINQG